METFSHYDIIDKHGNQVAEGHKASFCLEDSSCERGVFPKYNCQHYGQQGEFLFDINESSCISVVFCCIIYILLHLST